MLLLLLLLINAVDAICRFGCSGFLFWPMLLFVTLVFVLPTITARTTRTMITTTITTRTMITTTRITRTMITEQCFVCYSSVRCSNENNKKNNDDNNNNNHHNNNDEKQ